METWERMEEKVQGIGKRKMLKSRDGLYLKPLSLVLYIYIYIHIYIHIYTHTHIHTHIYILYPLNLFSVTKNNPAHIKVILI